MASKKKTIELPQQPLDLSSDGHTVWWEKGALVKDYDGFDDAYKIAKGH